MESGAQQFVASTHLICAENGGRTFPPARRHFEDLLRLQVLFDPVVDRVPAQVFTKGVVLGVLIDHR